MPPTATPGPLITFRTKRRSVCVRAIAGERVLFAGLRSGLDLPYECISGTCGTCQASPLNAASETLENLYPEAPAMIRMGEGHGRVLMCQSAAHGNVELRLFGQIAAMAAESVRPSYLRGTIAALERLTPYTVAFSVEAERPLNYRAGQFVAVTVNGTRGHRAYSMHKAPSGGRRLDFVIKLAALGVFSRWIANEARCGSPLELFGPLGRAVLTPSDPRMIFAIAGGTGIAGIIPIVEQIVSAETSNEHGATLLFGVRTLADAFFLDRLDALVKRGRGRMSVTVALSHETTPERLERFPRLEFRPGFVVEVARQMLLARSDQPRLCFFVAGPSPVVESGIAMLQKEFKVDGARIKFDRFL